MRALWLIALLCACKGKSDDKPAPAASAQAPRDATVVIDWQRCDDAVELAAKAPSNLRVAALLGCEPCGVAWEPLLGWTDTVHRREAIEHVMVSCDAFCTGDSKLKFMGGVDKARGSALNTPWRELAKACKDKVSAAGDARFMSAPYFALDRIARALAKRDAAVAAKLGALELALPALTVSGAGVELPTVDAAQLADTLPALHVTLLADAIFVGPLPRAKLGADGVAVDLGAAPYPGEQVPADKLATRLKQLLGDTKAPVLLLAPKGMSAGELVPVVGTASKVTAVHLAAAAPESPRGWQLPAMIRAPLVAKAMSDSLTVEQLAKTLVAK